MNTGFADMYQEEWPAFKEALRDDTEPDIRIKKMWDYLISLFEGQNDE
jgi:hypothetical protein